MRKRDHDRWYDFQPDKTDPWRHPWRIQDGLFKLKLKALESKEKERADVIEDASRFICFLYRERCPVSYQGVRWSQIAIYDFRKHPCWLLQPLTGRFIEVPSPQTCLSEMSFRLWCEAMLGLE